mgnify:CR=1 FL=1
MSIFDSLGQRAQPQQMDQRAMQAELGSIKADPGKYLKGHGFNIPAGMTDPKQITQHLLRTGQVGSPRLQQVMRMLGR